MSRQVYSGRGELLRLGRELGRGAEGEVYEVAERPDKAAKLYASRYLPNAKKQSKLKGMVGLAAQDLCAYAAWPQDTLHQNRGGPVIGFLMPKFANKAPVHVFYSPAHRKQEYPQLGWDFSLFAARNIAAAFSAVHGHGHVIGDVNQSNVLIGVDSKVSLLDCDSFQVKVGGEVHICEVGVPHFTPPELQREKSFSAVVRSSNSDNFGLAVLIFHMLFGGRHPYAGVPLREGVGDTLEADIREFRYAYSLNAPVRGIKPPPHAIDIGLAPELVRQYFEIAFTEAGVTARPTAAQWVAALDSVRATLQTCVKSGRHVFPRHLLECPWCRLEAVGIIYFGASSNYSRGAGNTVDVARLWSSIEAVPPPSTLRIPEPSVPVVPKPLPPGVVGSGVINVLRGVVVAIAFGLLLAMPKAWFILLIGGYFSYSAVESIGKDERNREMKNRVDALSGAKRLAAEIESRLRREGDSSRFLQVKSDLSRLRAEFDGLSAKERESIESLKSTAKERQLNKYLMKFYIDSSSIDQIGPSRKAALRSFGIETAADISYQKVRAVQGFGEARTRTMMEWRASCERRFVYNPQLAVTEDDIREVKAAVAARRGAIESRLSNGAAELQRLAQQVASARAKLMPQMQAAVNDMAQAQADLNAIR